MDNSGRNDAMQKFRTESTQSVATKVSHPFLELVRKGKAGATVVIPTDGSLDDEARKIVQAVYDQYSVELAVITGDQALKKLPTQHAIALGCLANNSFIESLYFQWSTLVDRWYPGTGGWVLQMIPSPHKQGNHVLLLGGSDTQGVITATARFIDQLKSYKDGRISWQLEVQLGDSHLPLPEDRMDCLGTAASPILIPESALPDKPYQSGFTGGSEHDHLIRLGMYGPHADNFHLSRSSQLGLRYLYTGRIEDAEKYRETLLKETRSGSLQKLYHYKSLRMFQLWPLLRDSPVFSDEERKEITQAICHYLLEESGVANMKEIKETSTGPDIFNRHIACDALNLWIGADWLWRQTGEIQWLDDRAVADTYFEFQSDTDVPLTGLTEGYATYLEVYLEWMLLSRPSQILENPHIRLWAQRTMSLCTNTGQLVLGPQTDGARYPYNLMRKLAYLLDDGSCLFVANLRRHQVRQGIDRVMQFSAGQAYAGDIEARQPDDVGLHAFPMNERLRQWKAPSIETGKGFDRAVARSGWEMEDDYLMIVGVRSGAKCLPNVGTLAAYERFGQRLITSDSVPLYPNCASPWRHSMVTVNAGGLGAGMAEGAKLLTKEEIAGGHLFSYQIDASGLYRWIRSFYWKPSAYVLVVDRVLVDNDETFTLGVNWRCAGEIMSMDDRLATLGLGSDVEGEFYVQVSEGLQLTSEINTYPSPGSLSGEMIKERMLHATMDCSGRNGEVEVATLLHAVQGRKDPQYQLGGHSGRWIIEGPDETVDFCNGLEDGKISIEKSLPIHHQSLDTPSRPIPKDRADSLSTRWTYDLSENVSTWTQTENGSFIALGTELGDVNVLDADGNPQWKAKYNAAITALTFFKNHLIVGTRSGQVFRLDEKGSELWRHQCQFRAERPFWSWWFLETPAVGALAAGKDPASDQELIAVGTGSTNLCFLNAWNGALVEDVVSPYGYPDRIQAHVSSQSNKLQFLAGHSWLTCGSSVRAWDPLSQPSKDMRFDQSISPMGRTMDGWDTCGVVDFWIGALVHGMPDKVVVLRHGAVNQITLYEYATGEPLWDATLGGAPVALAVMPGASDTTARCYVVEQFGWLIELDGTGKRIAAKHVTQSLTGIHICPEGDVLVWNKEELFIIQKNQTIDRCFLDGDPLGWYSNFQYQGFLCLQNQKLKMQDVRV
jgi:hypothetical protein